MHPIYTVFASTILLTAADVYASCPGSCRIHRPPVPFLIFLGIMFVVFIALLMFSMQRSTRTKDAAARNGVRYQGTVATASFHTALGREALEERIRGIVQDHKRFLRMESEPHGFRVYARRSIWTWGVVIDLTLAESNGSGTDVEARATCKVSTSVVDYGQNGKDLGLLIHLINADPTSE